MSGKSSLLLFGLIATLNWAAVLDYPARKRHASMIPVVGSVCGVVGCLLIPDLRPWAWVPPLLDPGTYAIAPATPGLFREAWQTCRFNWVSLDEGCHGAQSVEIRLFRAGVDTIRHKFDRPQGDFGMTGASSVGEWE